MQNGQITAREGDSAFVADARYFPLSIVTWFGSMTEGLAVKYFDWQVPVLLRAVEERTKFAFVIDGTQCSRPTPKIRKLIVELSDAGPKEADAYALPTFTALSSPLVRGAITAMQWVTRVDWRIVPVSSVRLGIQRALAALAAEGVTVRGLDAATFLPPAMPDASSSGSATG
jgi:hypothetical protein